MMHIKEVAREQGYVSTLFGRRRWIPELSARNPALRGAGERMAINMPIQGTAADIVKIAMIRLYDRLISAGTRARMLLQVHDELLLEVPRDELDSARAHRPRGDGGRRQVGCTAHGRDEERRRLGVDDAALASSVPDAWLQSRSPCAGFAAQAPRRPDGNRHAPHMVSAIASQFSGRLVARKPLKLQKTGASVANNAAPQASTARVTATMAATVMVAGQTAR